jgi:hypothetical protein
MGDLTERDSLFPPAFNNAVMIFGQFGMAARAEALRFEEALALVDAALQDLAEVGVDNHVNRQERAKYHALAGDYDGAMRELEAAVGRGLRIGYPVTWQMPMFERWQDDPRLLAAEAAMVQNINAERSALGLAPDGWRNGCRAEVTHR